MFTLLSSSSHTLSNVNTKRKLIIHKCQASQAKFEKKNAHENIFILLTSLSSLQTILFPFVTLLLEATLESDLFGVLAWNAVNNKFGILVEEKFGTEGKHILINC